MQTTLTHKRNTKNYAFYEAASDDDPVVDTLYVRLSAFAGTPPTRLTLTVAEAK